MFATRSILSFTICLFFSLVSLAPFGAGGPDSKHHKARSFRLGAVWGGAFAEGRK